MASRFGRAPRWIDFVLYAAWLAGVIALTSNVEIDFGKLALIAASALVAVVLWCFRGMIALGHGIDPPRTRREKLAWAALPATFLVAYAIASSTLPLRLRFLASEGALEEIALDSTEGHVGRAGLFRVEVRDFDGLRHLVTCDAGFVFDQAGFVYAPDAVPETTWPIDYRHLTGPWWTFYWHA